MPAPTAKPLTAPIYGLVHVRDRSDQRVVGVCHRRAGIDQLVTGLEILPAAEGAARRR